MGSQGALHSVSVLTAFRKARWQAPRGTGVQVYAAPNPLCTGRFCLATASARCSKPCRDWTGSAGAWRRRPATVSCALAGPTRCRCACLCSATSGDSKRCAGLGVQGRAACLGSRGACAQAAAFRRRPRQCGLTCTEAGWPVGLMAPLTLATVTTRVPPQPPIGPIGAQLSLTDLRWNVAAEAVLGVHLTKWIVSCREDERVREAPPQGLCRPGAAGARGRPGRARARMARGKNETP